MVRIDRTPVAIVDNHARHDVHRIAVCYCGRAVVINCPDCGYVTPRFRPGVPTPERELLRALEDDLDA